jgi:hypothetical protein
MRVTGIVLRLVLVVGLAVQVNAAQQAAVQQPVTPHQVKQKITSKVSATAAQAHVVYNGAPQFAPFPGTSITYATNTPQKIIHFGSVYYLCFHNVWVVSASEQGPWIAAHFVPEEITTIDCVVLGFFNPFGGTMFCALPFPRYENQECCAVNE